MLLPSAVASALARPAAALLKSALAAVFCIYIGGGLICGLALLSITVRQTAAAPSVGTALAERAAGSSLPLPSSLLAQAPLRFLPDWTGTDRINILLLGTDQRDDERAIGMPTRTDTIIVVSIDPVGKSVTMISFPRDLWLPIPGLGEQRINEAFPYGEVRKVPGGGPALTARTLDENFGLHVNYYALVNFRGFEEVVNTVGGIVVDVPFPLKDDEYPTEDYGIQRIYFPPGPQLMDGATALKYARSRHADNDLQRNTRQQQVLLAVRDRAQRLDLLTRLPTLIDQGLRAVQTDLAPNELLALGKLASQMDRDALTTLVIDYPLVRDYRGLGGAALLLPDRTAIRTAIRQALHEDGPTG